MATTVSTPQARTTTPKDNPNGSTGVPVGLIVAPILLCVLIAALIFLWILVKYKKNKKKRRGNRRKLNSGDSESIPSATSPGANSTHPSESESNKPLLSTSAYPSDEPIQSPGSGPESAVFADEQSEKGQNLDPIEERDDNHDARVRSVRPVQAAAPRQRLVQEEHAESAEDQDPSESGGEHEEEEPQSFRERRFDSGYRSYRTRPYYRDMYERYQPQLRPMQFDCHSNNDSEESEETEPKQVAPSGYLPVGASPGRYLQPLNLQQMDYQGSTYSDISDQSETLLKMPVEPAIPKPTRPGQESSDHTGCEEKDLDDDEDSDDECSLVCGPAQKGKKLQNNVQEDSEDESFAKKYIV